MSTGRFTRSRYEATNGNIHPIRVQPETLELEIGSATNTAPTGAVTAGVPSAKVSRGARGFGVRPAIVSFVFDEGEEPEGYAAGDVLRLPLLTPSMRSAATIGATGTYLNASITVVGVSPESVR